ncbi:MAG: hypothetical protein ACRC42_04705, partial [Mycoplasma sp.]
YKQIATAIYNNIEIDEEMIKQLTRQLAKRQMTWNRNKYEHIIRFNPIKDDYFELEKQVKLFLK